MTEGFLVIVVVVVVVFIVVVIVFTIFSVDLIRTLHPALLSMSQNQWIDLRFV